jgi:DNA-binding NtrC family response regulator
MLEEVRNGNFREDLLFRLNVVNLKIPPLRERPADIKLLSDHFAMKYAEVNGVPHRPISPEAARELTKRYWKGNVRELENTIHRAVLLASGDNIGPEAIMAPDGGVGETTGENAVASSAAATANETAAGLVGRTVADVERDLIIDTLRHCLGNRTHAANILGISIRTLRNKLKLYSEEGAEIPLPGEGSEPRRAAL